MPAENRRENLTARARKQVIWPETRPVSQPAEILRKRFFRQKAGGVGGGADFSAQPGLPSTLPSEMIMRDRAEILRNGRPGEIGKSKEFEHSGKNTTGAIRDCELRPCCSVPCFYFFPNR
jgi:hypothetical protein